MKCKEIIESIEPVYQPGNAMDWDNVGLLVGDREAEVQTILLAVDAADAVIEQAVSLGADMIITHHPMIFRGMKRITAEDFIGRRVLKLAQNGIACYAMHTNFDVGDMGFAAAEKIRMQKQEILEITGEADGKTLGIGVKGELPEAMTVLRAAEFVKQVFAIENVRIFGEPEHMVKRAAIVPGSGGTEIQYALEAGAEVMITGDIDHHEGLDAVAQGLHIIDAGHFGLEHIFTDFMEAFLEERLDGKVGIKKAREAAPYVVV